MFQLCVLQRKFMLILQTNTQMELAYVSICLMHTLYRISLFLIDKVLRLRRRERDFEIPAAWPPVLKKCFFQIMR